MQENCTVRCLRDIRAGDRLLMNYGMQYWWDVRAKSGAFSFWFILDSHMPHFGLIPEHVDVEGGVAGRVARKAELVRQRKMTSPRRRRRRHVSGTWHSKFLEAETQPPSHGRRQVVTCAHVRAATPRVLSQPYDGRAPEGA